MTKAANILAPHGRFLRPGLFVRARLLLALRNALRLLP
jgi:hypothetical protein